MTNCLNTTNFKGETEATRKQVWPDTQPVRTAGFGGNCIACWRVRWSYFFYKKYWRKFYTQVQVYIEVHNICVLWNGRYRERDWSFDSNRKRIVGNEWYTTSENFLCCSDGMLSCSVYTFNLFCQKEISWNDVIQECLHTTYTVTHEPCALVNVKYLAVIMQVP